MRLTDKWNEQHDQPAVELHVLASLRLGFGILDLARLVRFGLVRRSFLQAATGVDFVHASLDLGVGCPAQKCQDVVALRK